MKRVILPTLTFCAITCLHLISHGQDTSYQASVGVRAGTQIDWVYVLANQSPKEPPAKWLQEYDSTKQTYERFVPRSYRKTQSYPLVLFVSPSAKAMGFRSWKRVCEARGILFAGPHNAGNNRDTPQRVHILLDVLDDMRRQYNIDPDRTYIAGFSGGGRIACSIAFALPEYFGGVIPICAAGDLREESWLRQRVVDRLSVAHLTGETDFNRGEVERFRGPMLADVGVRGRVWVVPKMGHSMPRDDHLGEAFDWLEGGLQTRQTLAKKSPASRVDNRDTLTRDQLAKLWLDEGRARLDDVKTRYAGLMQLKGVLTRWPDLLQAASAKTVLLEYENSKDTIWETEDVAEQRRFLIARARALDAYASGALPKQYEAQRQDMAQAAINLWTIVLNDGQDARAAAQAKERIPALKRLLEGE